MDGLQSLTFAPIWGYVLAFGVAATLCFGGLPRARYIEDADSRRGLASFLLLSGGWALAHVGYLVAPTPATQYALYVVGLVVGFAAVGPWLYFCSAYTGRSLHRNSTVRWAAVGVFLAVTALKVTNPLHGQYFTTGMATTPFSHLVIHHGPLHWVVMGLAYALAFIGVFMLFELFAQVSYDTKPLFVVVSVTGLPVALDVLGATTPYLLPLTYSPLGVAAFAVGVSYVYLERFQAIHLTGETGDPMILVDAEGKVRDWNRAAQQLFPALGDTRGDSLTAVLPSVADVSDDSDSILELDRYGRTRYYRVTVNQFSANTARLGRQITLTDITNREQYRRQLERQNERLERFASLVSHDLRNPLSVAKGRVELSLEEGTQPEHLEPARDALDRMEELIDELLTLARTGRQIDETETVRVAPLATRSWEMVDAPDASLVVEDGLDTSVEADPERLQQLFENLFRNAVEHGGPDVTVTVGALAEAPGFYVADDGGGIPAEVRGEVFEPGFSTAEQGTGFGLPIVREIVEAHGWRIHITEAAGGGARFEIRTDSSR
ncbi:histidine kinase [Natronomonas halophila]|uniref:ATP-binding protein n=1 Tax=Natronomonas halophila TaxID=2747817 RepID=UPI0015B6CEC7|nr:ATP-binding protein [Natronomonas halophila]QLD86983.1 histidine kinase [Natronomonas halophila]